MEARPMVDSPEVPAVAGFPGTPKFSYSPRGMFVQLDIPLLTDRRVGNIILPQTAKQLSWLTAKVIGRGGDCKVVEVGMTVLLAKEGMTEVRHDGADPVFFTQEDKILAIVTPVEG